MQRVIETMMKWGEEFGETKLNHPTRFGNVMVDFAEAQIWSVRPNLQLSMGFVRFDPEKPQPGYWIPQLREMLEGTGIEVKFASWSPPSGNYTNTFEFPRVRREDACLTVFKTYLQILKLLGVPELNPAKHAPIITQGTYWRERGEAGKWRGLWIPHGKFLAMKLNSPLS